MTPGQNFNAGCLVCGAPLVYHEQPRPVTCAYCGGTFENNAACEHGHYVCDRCHSLGADDLIEQYCATTAETDPLSIAQALMRSPSLKMHGPEHHFLVPAALLAAYYNLNPEGEADPAARKAEKIRQARKRAENVKGGFCGFYGDCGAAVGVGIAVSLITGATPLATRAWSLANRATGETLLSIADHGGPRCCKRNTTLALINARRFFAERFDLRLPETVRVECQFYPNNQECLREGCDFFPRG